ncbi:MAG: hypothetical protein ACKVOU_10425 [Cytophagales bacterium]
MAATNNISLIFTSEEIAKVDKAFKDIFSVYENKLVTLTEKQRDENAKVGEGYETWIKDCYNGMLEIPKSIPDHISLPELEIDLAARKLLKSWLSNATTLSEQLNDTNLLVGNDLRNNALSYYGYAQAMQGHIPGLKPLVEKLSLFFKRTPKKSGS